MKVSNPGNCQSVLVVDDDPNVVELARLYLEREGFWVLTALDGADGLASAREERPDIVVLDVMLPRLNGLDVCRALREESQIPIIMLTARVEEEDRLMGLELGADDYITKPFSPRELAARVRAVLRRSGSGDTAPGPLSLSAGPVEIDHQYRRVRVNGAEVPLDSHRIQASGAVDAPPWSNVHSRRDYRARPGRRFRRVRPHRRRPCIQPEAQAWLGRLYGCKTHTDGLWHRIPAESSLWGHFRRRVR